MAGPLLLVVSSLLYSTLALATRYESTELRMPGVQPLKGEQYLCRTIKLDSEKEHYIVGFIPHADMHTAHHILLYGCSLPGSGDDVWDCGEMSTKEKAPQYRAGPVCATGSHIVYAWARDAPQFKLPDGVGFKTGGSSEIQYLVMQVHYMHPMEQPDYSGITLQSTTNRMPKTAGVLLMVTGGVIRANSKENFETACLVDENVKIHPFAFRTHTHQLGRVVSGYVLKDGRWTLIGKKNPQLPQMFYPVADPDITIKQNDIVAARCTMVNEEDHDVYIGATNDDEMCNFYMMYWAEDGKILKDNTCFSPGPPNYYWQKEGGLQNIPDKDASTA